MTDFNGEKVSAYDMLALQWSLMIGLETSCRVGSFVILQLGKPRHTPAQQESVRARAGIPASGFLTPEPELWLQEISLM